MKNFPRIKVDKQPPDKLVKLDFRCLTKYIKCAALSPLRLCPQQFIWAAPTPWSMSPRHRAPEAEKKKLHIHNLSRHSQEWLFTFFNTISFSFNWRLFLAIFLTKIFNNFNSKTKEISPKRTNPARQWRISPRKQTLPSDTAGKQSARTF